LLKQAERAQIMEIVGKLVSYGLKFVQCRVDQEIEQLKDSKVDEMAGFTYGYQLEPLKSLDI
jgi:hypothetical protein